MGKIVVHNQPCLSPSCKSSDGRQVYEEGTSFCFVCGTFFKKDQDPNEPHVAPKVDIAQTKEARAAALAEVKSYISRGFKERNITKVVCEFFNVKVSFNGAGEIDKHYYPYANETGYKCRTLPKSFTWIGEPAVTSLFGKEQFTGGGKRLIITEGELDALSVAQATYLKYGKFYPVVSVSSSKVTAKTLLENRDWVRSFKEVVLCLDNDEAGEEATKQAIKIIGLDKAKVWNPGIHKDASDVFTKEGFERLYQLIWDAQQYSPAGIISKEDIWKQIKNRNAIPSVPYPDCMKGVNSKIKGMRPGEIALFISGTGCLGLNTPVLMFNGGLKMSQDVVVGDRVMGPDNLPRNVKRLYRGQEQLYHVGIRGNEGFICNASHVHSVVNNDSEGRWGLCKNQVVDVELSEYIRWSDKRKHLSKTFKAGRLEFETSTNLPMHPYVLGVWLGDGYSAGSRISSNDIEIPNRLSELGYDIAKQATEFAWSFRGVQQILRDLNILNNKHIPEIYLTATIEDRLQLLAGLIDTDGCYDSSKNVYEFSQADEYMTDQFIRLANSLGFQATKGKQVNNKFGNCFRVWVSGAGLEDIPVVLERKKARYRQQIKNPLRFKTEIIDAGFGDFYGFEVDADGRFVLGNYIVTHNSGKSTLMREAMIHIINTTTSKIGIISLEESPGETGMKLAAMEINRNPSNEEISDDDLEVGFNKLFGDDRIVVLDHQGSISDDSVLEKLEYMALLGCEYLFIDHVTILVSEGAEGKTGNEAIDLVMNHLLRLVKRHPVWVGLVSHLRKVSTGGKSFEEGKMPTMDDIRGSGSIKQISFDIIAFSRNMASPDETIRNAITMSVLKSRTIGLTGPVTGATYDHATGRLTASEYMGTETFDDL